MYVCVRARVCVYIYFFTKFIEHITEHWTKSKFHGYTVNQQYPTL